MNPRQRKTIIFAASALLAAAAAALLAWGLLAPVRVALSGARPDPADRPVARTGKATESHGLISEKLDLDRLRRLCARRLRKGLDGDSDQGDPTAAPPPASLPVKLIGIAVEPGHSMAMFRLRDGAIELRPAGGLLDDGGAVYTIESIGATTVTLSLQGRRYELELPRPMPQGGEQ